MEGMFNKMADYKVQNVQRWIWYKLAISNVRIQQCLHRRDVTTVAQLLTHLHVQNCLSHRGLGGGFHDWDQSVEEMINADSKSLFSRLVSEVKLVGLGNESKEWIQHL